MRHLDLFSGIGGFALAASSVWGDDYQNAGFCEIEPFAQAIIKKHFPNAIIHEDILALNEGLKNGTIVLWNGDAPIVKNSRKQKAAPIANPATQSEFTLGTSPTEKSVGQGIESGRGVRKTKSSNTMVASVPVAERSKLNSLPLTTLAGEVTPSAGHISRKHGSSLLKKTSR